MSSIEESASDNVVVRKEDGIKAIKAILENNLEVDLSEVKIKNVLRLGISDRTKGRSRLMKVG